MTPTAPSFVDAPPEGAARSAQAELLSTKIQPPPVREQLVRRDHLLERLSTEGRTKLTVVAAPAGFGKTSLLSSWHFVESQRRAMAWLTVDDEDNDPWLLLAYLVASLARVSPRVKETVPAPTAVPAVGLLLPRLANAVAEEEDVTLIVDDFQYLTDGPARDAVRWLVEHAPPSLHVVISSRREPDLGLAALRVHGDLCELRAEDLRWTTEEADAFLNGRQMLELSADDVRLLVERTDGWPAGLYLAALSLRRSDDRHDLVSRFGASNRHVVDFLESEVLEAHDPKDRVLMRRCSVLERFSGMQCDAVFETSGSSEALERLSRSNLFLIPLDDEGGWYRLHPLFGQLLRVELERQEPGFATTLHQRAFAWHRDRGDASDAIRHALEAGMVAEAADLVVASWYEAMNSGRSESALGWIDRFPRDFVETDVPLLLARAWLLSVSGHQSEAADCIALAEALAPSYAGPMLDGFRSAEASLTTMRAAFPWTEVGSALETAERAGELEGPGSPWHVVPLWAMGRALLAAGRNVEADAHFARALELVPARGHWMIGTASLAYRALIAGQSGDLDGQARFAEQAVAMSREHGLDDSAAGPPMALGASLIARGHAAEALPVLEHGVRVAQFGGQPLVLIRMLRSLAQAQSMVGDTDGAARTESEVRAVLAACVDPATLAAGASTADREVADRGSFLTAPLTPRELSILALLAGRESEAQISRRLFVTHSTVHSHVKSIYRKLGASSRQAAVARAREAGFV